MCRARFGLFRPAIVSQTLILIPAALNSKEEKCSFRGQTAQKLRYNLRIRYGTWKFRSLNQSRSKVDP